MLGTMMDFDLTVGSILRHANRFHGDREIATRLPGGDIHRYTYRDLYRRCGRLCNSFATLGVRAGDRVGTLASNSFRHLEIYFSAPSMGAIVHTINPRLYPEQITYIINHSEDAVLLIDPEYIELVNKIRSSLRTVKHIIVLDNMADREGDFSCYEALIDRAIEHYEGPVIDERTGAALCYTSGTTGNPKGVLYTHRSAVLHSMMVSGADWFALRKRDAVMPIVPMYHVMAWSLPFAAAMNGSKLVLPRAASDSANLLDLISREKVTLSAAVPTIWCDMLAYLEAQGKSLTPLERVIVGGSAPTPSLIKALEGHGVKTLHGWGMTETSSNGLLNTPDHNWHNMGAEEQRKFLGKQGRPPYPVNVKIVTADAEEAPWDGKALGHLCVSGPTIAGRYYGHNEAGVASCGHEWLDTGDIATIDSAGYVEIVDRDKDLIKSGGEWISSIVLENIAASHPDVLEAAVISVPHPRWDERPLLLVVPRRGRSPTREEMLTHFVGKVAKWSIPDDVVFVESLPRQATGKVSKARLREQFAGVAVKKADQKA